MRNISKSVAGAIKSLAEFFAGACTAIIAMLIATLGCKVLVAAFVMSVVVTLIIKNSKRFSRRGKVVIIVFAVLAMMSTGIYHKLNCHNMVENPEVSATTDNNNDVDTEEVVVEETNEVVEEETTPVCKSSNRLDEKTRKECIDLVVTRENSQNIDEGKEEVEGSTTTTFVSEDNKGKDVNDDKIVEESKADESKEVTELEEGVTAVTDKVVEEDSKVEPQEEVETEKVEIPEEVEEVTSEESKEVAEETIEATTEEVETDKEEDFADMSDEELEDLFVETTTETVEVVETEIEVEEVEVEETIEVPVNEKVENQDIVEDEVIEDTVVEDEIVVEDVVEVEDEVEEATEEVEVEDVVVEEKVEEVAVTAIDGYTTTVGSQIQFQVSGDDVVIEGLDGINYTFSNGILTIDAGSEATVLSVCISNSVNSVDLVITVNGIIG